jgi:hypothetical protein
MWNPERSHSACGATGNEGRTVNFGPDRYVPVLKVKRAEKGALTDIGNNHPGAVTPLLEIVAKKPEKSLPDHIDTAFDKLAQSIASLSPCFLDTREMAPEGDAAAIAIYKRARAEGIEFVPVVGITRAAGNAAALQFREKGVALRVTRAEMESGGLATAIHKFLQINNLKPEAVDMIMDMGYVGDMISVGVSLLATSFLQAIPNRQSWRTFTLSGCAFPSSMGRVGKNAHLLVDRSEWICWKGLYDTRTTLDRLPSFSDCAIQHPDGVEGFDPKTMAASAAARYTAANSWLLVKGESTKIKKPSGQFLKIAKEIVSNKHGHHYSGVNHCTGCRMINDAANGAPKLGSLEKWRLIGSIHHVSTVLKDLSALHWP